MAWERAGLITSQEQYSFEALSQMRKLRDLQATARISAKSIRASVDAMQRVRGHGLQARPSGAVLPMEEPAAGSARQLHIHHQAAAAAVGLVVRHGGRTVTTVTTMVAKT